MPDPQESSLVVFVQILTGGARNQERCFFDEPQLTFGRRKEPPAQVLFGAEDGMVSNLHATLTREGDGYVLVDESRFGTVLLDHNDLGPDVPSVQTQDTPVSRLFIPVGGAVSLRLGGLDGPRCRLMVGRAIPFGDYLLVGLLGKGGMGKVYLAWYRRLGRLDVLKVIRQSMLMRAPEAEQMLLDEAKIDAKLKHTHAAVVYDAHREPGSKVLYISMEYIRGITLGEMATQFAGLERRMPPDFAAALIRQACLGLHAAHTAQDTAGQPMKIVHRDVSPHNILCSSEGTVKVIDFGVARAKDRLSQTASSDGRIVGNPGYMSPEHIERPKTVDFRSDIFSMGVVLYEMLTAKRLFYKGQENVQETWEAIRACQVPPLQEWCPEAKEVLAEAVHRTLQKRPEERHGSALELQRALQQAETEYGSQFLHPEDIARFATQSGIVMLGRLPRPLKDRPEEIPEPGETSTGGSSPGAESGTPVLAADQLAEGRTIAGERYRLVRRLSPDQAVQRRPFWKLYYLVERQTDPPEQVVALICGGTESPYALPGYEGDRFFDFAERRRGLPRQGHMPPVLDQGSCWRGGPSYLTQPYYRQTLRDLIGVRLSVDEKVGLARRLFSALLTVQNGDHGYVHGDLKPENIALVQLGEDPYHVIFLDLTLHVLLKLPEATNGPPPVNPSPFLSPARRLGAPPSACDDVFSLAMVCYELFGGDPERAAQAISTSVEPPALGAGRHDAPAHVVRALTEALRPDPAHRPSAGALVRRLLDTPTVSGKMALADIQLPPLAGPVIHTSSQQRVELRHVHVRPWDDTDPIPIGLSLPAFGESDSDLIRIYPSGTSLELRLSEAARSQRRIEFYREPPGPNTHCQRYDLPGNSTGVCFYVGYRKQELQKIFLAGVALPGTPGPLTLAMPDLGLRFSVPLAQRLIAMYTVDGRRETVHVVCITVGPA